MRGGAPLTQRGMVTCRLSPCRMQGIASAVMVISSLAASVLLAPAAVADSADSLRAAVMAARTASCGPLRSDPIVERVAENVNQSTDAWIDHTARAVPVPDPLPVLKDFGYGGSKATMAQGTGHTGADAIKGLLLGGYNKVPDCSYKDYGVSVMQNRTTKRFLMALVLAGT